MSWKKTYQQKLVSLKDAAAVIESNDRIVTSFANSLPIEIFIEIDSRYKELENVTITGALCIHPFGFLKDPNYKGHIRYHSIYMGPLEKMFLANIDFTSYNFSRADWLLHNLLKPNVLITEVSPPNKDGYMSFGFTGSMLGKTASELASKIIVQVNKNVPFIHGGKQSFLHVDEVTHICEAERDIMVWEQPAPTEIDEKIASNILPYIHDGSTIQLGIGGGPNAIGYHLEAFKDLGMHTEMMSDSMATLIEKGVINGRKKTLHNEEAVCSFVLGSKRLYEFVDDNPKVQIHPLSYVNDPYVIAQNNDFVSINGCLSCDLTGQVCSESIGFHQHSATGGQLDFVRAAAVSDTAKSFLCMESTTTLKDGTRISKITAALEPGAIVTTPRSLTQFVATEYGVADLREKCTRERTESLIRIAHPDFRDSLIAQAKEYKLIG